MQQLLKISNLALKFLTAAILLAIPLYPKFPFISIPGTFVSVRLEDILILVSMVFMLPHIMVGRSLKFILNIPVTRSILLYLGVATISLLSALFVTQTVTWHIGVLHFLRRIEYFAPFIVGFWAIKNVKRSEDYFVKLIIIVILMAFAYGLGQKYYNFPIIITQNEEYSKGLALRYVAGSHINSTFAGHYDLATYLILTLPIVSSLLFLEKSRISKFFTGSAMVGGLWLLVNSASRISFLSYLVAILVALFTLKKYWQAVIVCIISLAFIGTSSNLIARYSRFFDVFILKYLAEGPVASVYAADESVVVRNTPTPTPLPVFEDRSTNIRLAVEWPRAIRAFSKNPLLGTGYSSITLATDNDYLRLLGETGILGFITFCGILASVFTTYLKKYSNILNTGSTVQKAFISGFIGSFAGLLINALFIDVFEASKIALTFWMIAGISYAILTENEKGKKYD